MAAQKNADLSFVKNQRNILSTKRKRLLCFLTNSWAEVAEPPKFGQAACGGAVLED